MTFARLFISRHIFPAIFLWCLSLAPVWAAPLDAILAADILWKQTPEAFMDNAKSAGFTWTSASQDSARAAGPELTLHGTPVVECIVRFAGLAPRQATVVFYARGDAGNMNEENFATLVGTTCETLNQATMTKFSVRGKDPTSAVKAEGLVWETPAARYLLEYSKVREVKTRNIPFRAEFVRLQIDPPIKATGLAEKLASSQKPTFLPANHVKTDTSTGDVWISDVPMVDQGRKGYCVVASIERVLRYYGSDVDANELAQVANSSAAGGTSYEAMYDALKKLSTRLKIRVRQVEKTDIRDILQLIADYNREARRTKVPPIPEQGQMIDMGEVYRSMDDALLKDIRTKNKSDLTRFQRAIQSHVDEGTPLLWTVMLGKVPEKDIPQNAGGHMRMIIGYNPKTAEILYTDSWGAGHELKRMPLDDAWTMTTGTMSIETF